MQSDPPMFSAKAILDRPYESGTFEGPGIGVVLPEIRQYEVNPDSGSSDETFNYSAVVNYSKPTPIELQTFNPLLNQYESKATQDYNRSGQNQTLVWKVKFPAEFQGKRLSYKFRYQGNDLAVANGPTIQIGGNPKIYNSTVSPLNGSIDTEFSYNVLIGFKKRVTLDLQAYNPEHRQYESLGLKDYLSPGNNETLVWKVKFPPEYAGENVSYKIRDAGTGIDLLIDRGPNIKRNESEESEDSNGGSGYVNGDGSTDNGATTGTVGSITVRGNVSPSIGFIQEWDEKDSLYELTYILQLENWTSQDMPWVQLVVKPYSQSSWKTVGEKQKYDPSLGKVTWKIKPFWNTPFLGLAEYKFLVDNAESQIFKGPNIVARYKAADSWSSYTHKFNATINASANLTVCLLGGDNRLPENIKSWKQIGDCKRYVAGSGEQNLSWKLPDSRPLYYDFDIQLEKGEGMQ